MRWIPWIIAVSLICFWLVLIWPPFESHPTSAEIRLDSGDLRYLRSGEVIETAKLAEPYRSTILAASEKSDILKKEWHRCATFPLPSSNHPDWMYQDYYVQAAAWLSADPEIGLLILEDVARNIKQTDTENLLPDGTWLLSLVSRKPDGTFFIPEGWQDFEEVKSYLNQRKSAHVE